MTSFHDLAAISRSRHGIVPVENALQLGYTHRQLDGLVEAGILVRRSRGVLAVAGVRTTWFSNVSSAIAACGPDALASHHTAAYLHRLVERRPDRIEVVMRRWDRSRKPFVVHESLDLEPEDATTVHGIPVTTPVRTVVDLGASARWLVPTALDTGLRQGLFTLEDVARFVKRVQRRGRRGVGVIRPLIQERLTWDGVTESELEDRFRRFWADFEPKPVPQWEIHDERGSFICRCDFAFLDAKVRIELDSEAYHMDRETFRKDRRVQNLTELLGWTTLRYTWWDLTNRPEAVVGEIRSVLLQRSNVRHQSTA